MNFSVRDVKELRKVTGAGMMACKNALKESAGSMDAAIDFLRKKGLAAAQKRQSRIAAEGSIATIVSEKKGVILEVNCETDFVSGGNDFKDLVMSMAQTVLDQNIQSLDDLRESQHNIVSDFTLKCGEKIDIRRFRTLEVDQGRLGHYNHGGRIGVLVGLETSSSQIQSLSKDLAMHIAACDPKFISSEDIDEDFKRKEAEIYRAQFKEQGRPSNIIDKIVQGKLRKLATEVCLLEQKFVKDQDKTIKQLIKEFGEVKVTNFIKFNLGEGIEKREDSLSEEVAKLTKS